MVELEEDCDGRKTLSLCCHGFSGGFFKIGERFSAQAKPQSCVLTLPDGQRLQASVQQDSEYPCINIILITADGEPEQVCFVEHNSPKASGHELCICAYQAGDDEPAYYFPKFFVNLTGRSIVHYG